MLLHFFKLSPLTIKFLDEYNFPEGKWYYCSLQMHLPYLYLNFNKEKFDVFKKIPYCSMQRGGLQILLQIDQ